MSMKESDGDGRTAAFTAMLPELEHFEESAIASALQRVGPVLSEHLSAVAMIPARPYSPALLGPNELLQIRDEVAAGPAQPTEEEAGVADAEAKEEKKSGAGLNPKVILYNTRMQNKKTYRTAEDDR